MPKDVAAVEALAEVYENKSLYFSESFDQTIATYNDALALEPHNATYPLKIGKIRAMQASSEKDDSAKKKLIVEAKEWLQKAVDEKSDLAEAQYQLGSTKLLLGETTDAIGSLQKAIAVDNTKADYFLALAGAYQNRGAEGDYDAAESIYKNIISVLGDDSNTNLSLGLLYEKMKRFDDAAEQYRKVSDLLGSQDFGAKNQIQKMIDNAKRGVENTPENLKDSTIEN